MRIVHYLLLSSYASAQKPGFITTITSDFLKEYTGDIMHVFESTCSSLEIEPQKLSWDMEIMVATMSVWNQ